jgi:putative membrane protein
MLDGIVLSEVISMLFYTGVGMGLMYICWKVVDIVTPFPVIKEIEEDQNVALAILIGAIFIAMAIIIAAVVLSD